MAANIQIKYPNFCFCPQAGTFGTINQDSATTILRIKTSAGGLVSDYSLSSNILSTMIHLEYVGPANITEIMDGLTFFTVEKLNTSTSIIKRWETRPSSSQLNLKQQIIKTSTGSYYYDTNGAAVEHYRRVFSLHAPAGSNSIVLNSGSRVETGARMFLGPSNDADNLGLGEYVTVSHAVGSTIHLTGVTTYDYVIGDQACFYNNVYLISNISIGGGTSTGSMFKLDANNGAVKEVNTDKVYRNITTARWNETSQTIAVINANNSLFIQPYVSYLNWKSVYLNNMENTDYNMFEVYDILYDEFSVYKLMHKKTTRDDTGNKSTEDWGAWYNYQQDTLLPYTNCIEISTPQSYMIGQNDTTTFYIKVIDQYGVGLSNKTVNLYRASGDTGSVFDPVNGQITTDINGEGSVDYTSGSAYTGMTKITCRADGSSSYTGSQYVWNSIYIYSEVDVDDVETVLYQDKQFSSSLGLRDVEDEIESETAMRGRSWFTTPGGNWFAPNDQGHAQATAYLPMLLIGDHDGPVLADGAGFSAAGPPFSGEGRNIKPNQITQALDFNSGKDVIQLKNYNSLGDRWVEPPGEFQTIYAPPYAILRQIIETSNLQLSQLKVSTHTFWTGGSAYDYLWTYVDFDQFIFVEDAIPVFWSEKNPIDTDIWIRLRPFAYSLNATTLSYYVKEIWWGGDTGYVDVSSQVTYQYFDAGGGILGVELTYNPIQDFRHDSIVYVYFGLYDTAPIPNWITTGYWFAVIPDYKSPYLDNLNPTREQENVAVDTDIYFEIKDLGAGVDIDTLEVTVNSRYVTPTSIIKMSDNHYKVTYDSTDDYFYNKRITVGVKVDDLSNSENWLNDRYSFYTPESEDLIFTKFEPGACRRGLPRFQDVSFVVLGTGEGVDESTLRLQIRDKDVTDDSTVVPVIYRLS